MNRTSGSASPVGANGEWKNPRPVPSANGAEPPRLRVCRWVLRSLFPGLHTPVRIRLWNGDEFTTSPGQPACRVHIRNRWDLVRMVVKPALAFGDAYSEGRIEVEGDLVGFLEQVFRAWPRKESDGLVMHWLRGRSPRRDDNSLTASRDNIHYHYDLGNDFYRLWLDEQLVYTCAYFPTPGLTLEEAQVAKMDHVCRKLRLRPGQSVVEAGCGWGALSRHMARHYGVKVTAFNISREQVRYARESAAAEGLGGRVRFVEDDYRNVSGEYDAFVSVGMLEHVGPAHYPELGAAVRRCLKPGGLGLIHSIGQNRPAPTNAWLATRIFPGAYMPALSELLGVLEPCDFSVLDVENLRLHYARTLGHWLRRFERVADRVEARFDRRFVRAWRLYLASSLAGFSAGFFQLFQVVFAHGANNDLPWSRARIYHDEVLKARDA